MNKLNRDNLGQSAESFLAQTGHNIIGLLNTVLTDKADLARLVEQNNVEVISSDLPGLIVQAYLVLVKLFDLNVMDPINNTKVEITDTDLTPPNSIDYVDYEDQSEVDSDGEIKVELLTDEFVQSDSEGDEPPVKRQKRSKNSDRKRVNAKSDHTSLETGDSCQPSSDGYLETTQVTSDSVNVRVKKPSWSKLCGKNPNSKVS